MTTRLENLLGALGVALSDSMDAAFDAVCAVGDSAPAALILIRENPDTRIEALARYLALSHSGTVRLVDRLVERGWVAREACTDKRAVVLVLTKAGEKVAAGLLEGRHKSLARALAGISAADRRVLERLLPHMLTNLVTDRAAADHNLPLLRLRRLRARRLPAAAIERRRALPGVRESAAFRRNPGNNRGTPCVRRASQSSYVPPLCDAAPPRPAGGKHGIRRAA